MGIGVSKQASAAAAAAGSSGEPNRTIKGHIHDVKPIISPVSTTPTSRNSNASFISSGFGAGGFDTSNQLLHHHHVRQPSVRRPFQPMPDRQELDQRFAKVLVSNRHQIVVGVRGDYYDDERKEEIVLRLYIHWEIKWGVWVPYGSRSDHITSQIRAKSGKRMILQRYAGRHAFSCPCSTVWRNWMRRREFCW